MRINFVWRPIVWRPWALARKSVLHNQRISSTARCFHHACTSFVPLLSLCCGTPHRRPPLSDKFPAEMIAIIQDCWAQEPSKRPAMQEVLRRLREVQEQGLLDNVHSNSGCCTIS